MRPELYDWWARYALLTPETDRPQWQVTAEANEPPVLADTLSYLCERLPKANWPNSPPARAVALGEGVFDAWRAYSKAARYDMLGDDLDGRLWGTYGRLPVQALKVAMILAALDWTAGDAPVINWRTWCAPLHVIRH